ncbi:MAG: exodeoxyribonuclease VII small subunit [Alphaproteobacteria bacterium]|nr:exodeoxyribonuclease VII small subunit [Alphaproteobacteria bacterium]
MNTRKKTADTEKVVPPDMPFEQAMSELEHLVRSLEQGTLPLDDAIKAYERGLRLQRHCEERLTNAQLRIQQITLKAEGTVDAAPFDP